MQICFFHRTGVSTAIAFGYVFCLEREMFGGLFCFC